MRVSMRMFWAGPLAVAASVIVPVATAPAEAACAVPPGFHGDPPPCPDAPPPIDVPQPGKGLLVIAEATDPPDPQMFSFTLAGAFEGSFELDGDPQRPPEEPAMFHVPAGPYTVTQSLCRDDWYGRRASCRLMESLPWSALTQAAPALAEFGERRLAAAPSYLATIRGESLPRVHPVTARVRDGHLCVYMYPTSPKGKDLRHDGRFALHTSVPDNDGTGGEFHLRGHGRPVDDPTTVGLPARDGYVLFELLLDEALAVSYPEDGAPTRQSWRRTA